VNKFNPVFWLMWLIPGTAVVAGLGLVVVAMRDADRALPALYHWEGERLDVDFERARMAAQLGIRATLQWEAGACILTLTPASQDPRALQVHLTHANDAALDHMLTFLRASPGRYRADCAALPAGRWRLALTDDAGAWALRTQFEASVTRLDLRARDPAGPKAGGRAT
jgi:hypothetical protein